VVLFLCVSYYFYLGCGHNGVIYRNGDYWNIGVDPNTYSGGIQRFNGEMLMIGSKENTSVEVSMESDDSGKAGITSGTAGLQQKRISGIKYSTGIQINGYMVDLAKDNPELAALILAKMQAAGKTIKYYIVKDNKLVEVTKTEYDNSTETKFIIDGQNQQVKQ